MVLRNTPISCRARSSDDAHRTFAGIVAAEDVLGRGLPLVDVGRSLRQRP